MSPLAASGTAFGKFILLGEHFVAHGGTAIAFPLPELFCKIDIFESKQPEFSIQIPNPEDLLKVKEFFQKAVEIASTAFGIKNKIFSANSSTNFPIARGLGSSAAFSVALTRGFEKLAPPEGNTALLTEVANKIEMLFHSSPSGIDTTTIMKEVPIIYQKNKPATSFTNSLVDFVVIDGGDRENCADLQNVVGSFKAKNPERWKSLSLEMEQLVSLSQKIFSSGKKSYLAGLAEVIAEAHKILGELELSTAFIEKIIADGKANGALAGKVSGAGRGGAVVLVAPNGLGTELASRMKKKGFRILVTRNADTRS